MGAHHALGGARWWLAPSGPATPSTAQHSTAQPPPRSRVRRPPRLVDPQHVLLHQLQGGHARLLGLVGAHAGGQKGRTGKRGGLRGRGAERGARKGLRGGTEATRGGAAVVAPWRRTAKKAAWQGTSPTTAAGWQGPIFRSYIHAGRGAHVWRSREGRAAPGPHHRYPAAPPPHTHTRTRTCCRTSSEKAFRATLASPFRTAWACARPPAGSTGAPQARRDV